MTEWPVRRVGNKLTCGRRVGGQHVCQGYMGWVINGKHPAPPTGYVEAPPGSGFYVLARRSARLRAEGRSPILRRPFGRKREDHARDLPWRLRCPHCRVVGVVTDEVLDTAT